MMRVRLPLTLTAGADAVGDGDSQDAQQGEEENVLQGPPEAEVVASHGPAHEQRVGNEEAIYEQHRQQLQACQRPWGLQPTGLSK